MKRVRAWTSGAGLLIAALSWTGMSTPVEGQTYMRNRDFLNLGSAEPYLNYGRKEYDPYPDVITARNKYDRLGNFQVRGYDVLNWELNQPGFSQISSRRDQYLGWFNNLVILSDSYRGWNYKATVGEDIRTNLTDLTMNDPRWYGIRMDGASSDNKFTLLLSQGGAQAKNPKFSTFQNTKERSPVLVFGGRWQTNLGSVLQVGTTYFNQHMVDTFNEKGSFWRGDTPYSMLPPSFITVIIEDDSPDVVSTPATVYDVDIVIRGHSRGEAVRLSSMQGDPDYDATLEPRRTGGLPVADGGRQVAGPGDRVEYTFQMPESLLPDPDAYSSGADAPLGLTIEAVRFQADVAGDYRIAVRQQHVFFDESTYQKNLDKGYVPGDDRYVNPYTGLKGADAALTPIEAAAAGEDVFNNWPVRPDPATATVNPFLQYKWDLQNPEEVSYTVVRSNGRGLGGSNRKLVQFDYGIPTGQALYGMDWKLELKDFTVTGEFSTNPQYFIFPVGSDAGKRSSKRAWAYFVNAKRRWRNFEFGAEVFSLDPDYSGNYDSVRGGIPFFSDITSTRRPEMQEMYVMTDNDDNDQWPDEYVNELPSADKIDSGVFPGLDENQDLIPDTDQNVNGIPDWSEPILFFDADPPEFVYGIDFNNNGVVDFRENDALPDYPYRRDRHGTHLLVSKDHLGRFGEWVSVGTYRMKERAGGNKSSAYYGRYEYRGSLARLGRLEIDDDVKWVKDSIADDVYIWRDLSSRRIDSPYPSLTGKVMEERDLNSQLLPPPADPLTMRHSFVNTLFVSSQIDPAPDVHIINNLLWNRNSQRADEFSDGSTQDEDVRSLVTTVNKVSYTLRAGDLTIRPMFKHLLLRERSQKQEDETGKGSIRSYSIYSPILRMKYDLTPKSGLELGLQGFPFWSYRHIDRVDQTQDFSEWTILLMMTNRSDYYGYNMASQLGWSTTERKYDDKSMAALGFDNSRLFFDIVAGF